MSKFENRRRRTGQQAVALQYGSQSAAPVVVASGSGYLAEKIIEVASQNGVPIYEDNSLATILAQLKLGQEIPEELYKAIVDIYVYFLHFDPNDPDAHKRRAREQAEREQAAQEQAAQEEAAPEPTDAAPPPTEERSG